MIKSANSILILGGGPTTVKLAAEIAVDFPDSGAVGDQDCWNLLEKVLAKGTDLVHFKESRSHLGKSVDVSSASDGAYKTSGGETIVADCRFVCIGIPTTLAWLTKAILKDSLDRHGRPNS